MIRLLVLVSFLSLAVPGLARDLTTAQKLSDFDQLNATIESSYGPYEYKNKILPISLQNLKEIYRERVAQTKDNSDFYYVMVQYVHEFHDGHFGLTVPTDHVATLPIKTDLIDRRILVESVDRTIWSTEQYPIEKGDEILSVNGQQIIDVVNGLAQQIGSGYIRTEMRNAARSVFLRKGTRFPVPSGNVTFTYRARLTGEVQTISTNWNLAGNPLDEFKNRLTSLSFTTGLASFRTLSSRDIFAETFGEKWIEQSYQCSGTTRIKIPDGAKMIVEKPFVAYSHETPFGRVGYLRIPHYYFEGKYEEVFKQYEYAVDVLERTTVGLIIDQDHNCGGSVDFLEKMVGLFMDKPFAPMQFQFLASKKEYLSFKAEFDKLPENTRDRELGQQILSLIWDGWSKGSFLTEKGAFNFAQVIPNPIRYTKPIVMLIDEMSGSGGDAFPSLMQGYGRATLFGHRTAGLGGHVEEMPGLNYSGLKFRMTKSLFYRPDGTPVENNGAVPNFNYEPTLDDFMNGYQNYHQSALDVLKDLLPRIPYAISKATP